MASRAPALARRERADLADLLDEVGPDAPTLCAGWSTYDLAAHLALRDASPAAMIGVVVPPLEQLTDKGMGWVKSRHEYADLVRRLREGPPWYSPMRPSRFDRMFNTLEFFVHHEDVRRAGADPKPRELTDRDQRALWRAIRSTGKALARNASVGIELVRADVPDAVRISRGEPTLVVRGRPSELALFAYGRGAVADVEISGDAEAVRRLDDDQLGI